MYLIHMKHWKILLLRLFVFSIGDLVVRNKYYFQTPQDIGYVYDLKKDYIFVKWLNTDHEYAYTKEELKKI